MSVETLLWPVLPGFLISVLLVIAMVMPIMEIAVKRLSQFRKLSIAISAAALVGVSAQPVVSYDVTPGTFVALVAERLAVGDVAAARAIIERMRSYGVRMILVGDVDVSLDELLAILTDPTPASRIAIADLRYAVKMNLIRFVVGNRIVSAIDTTSTDRFPVGSAG